MKWNEKLRKKFEKIKSDADLFKKQYAIGYNFTEKKSLQKLIKGFDKYRVGSGLALFFLTLYFLFVQDFSKFFYFLGITHFHAMMNQFWHKLNNIEKYLENNGGNQNG